jgi:hypothetical protein
VGKINATGTANNTTFLRGDGTWTAPTAPEFASMYINNATQAAIQNLSISSSISNGITITGGTTFQLKANKLYEVTASVLIYNTANEAYVFMFYDETNNTWYNAYPMFFGQFGNDRDYNNQVITFMIKPTVNNSFTFRKFSTNSTQGNLIGNISIKEIK